MQNKFTFFFIFLAAITGFSANAQINMDANPDEMAAAAIDAYQASGSVFEQITMMEQEKVLLNLEKERAALDLDLDRLAAEKIKLHMEMEALTGRAEEQQRALDLEKEKIAAEFEKLEQEKLQLQKAPSQVSAPAKKSEPVVENSFAEKYTLLNILGAGRQLEATIAHVDNGQTRRISVGKNVDGFIVKSISLNDGVVFEKDGEIQTLNMAK